MEKVISDEMHVSSKKTSNEFPTDNQPQQQSILRKSESKKPVRRKKYPLGAAKESRGDDTNARRPTGDDDSPPMHYTTYIDTGRTMSSHGQITYSNSDFVQRF